jgi:hypothetical protein
LLLGVWLSVCACPLALWQLGGLAGRWQAAIAAVLGSLLLPLLSQSILLRGPQAPRRLQWDGQGGYSIDLAGGYREPVTVHRASLASARWLWLVVQGRRRYTLFLDRQGVDPSAYAALRRQLRTFRRSKGQ